MDAANHPATPRTAPPHGIIWSKMSTTSRWRNSGLEHCKLPREVPRVLSEENSGHSLGALRICSPFLRVRISPLLGGRSCLIVASSHHSPCPAVGCSHVTSLHQQDASPQALNPKLEMQNSRNTAEPVLERMVTAVAVATRYFQGPS